MVRDRQQIQNSNIQHPTLNLRFRSVGTRENIFLSATAAACPTDQRAVARFQKNSKFDTSVFDSEPKATNHNIEQKHTEFFTDALAKRFESKRNSVQRKKGEICTSKDKN